MHRPSDGASQAFDEEETPSLISFPLPEKEKHFLLRRRRPVGRDGSRGKKEFLRRFFFPFRIYPFNLERKSAHECTFPDRERERRRKERGARRGAFEEAKAAYMLEEMSGFLR